MINLGATCFLNSLTQAVACIPRLRDLSDNPEWSNIASMLPKGVVHPARWIHTLQSIPQFPELRNGQGDAHEALLGWISIVPSSEKQLEWKLTSTLDCSCGYTNRTPERTCALEVAVATKRSEGPSLSECLSSHFNPETVEACCEKCKNKGMTKTITVDELPSVLAISLKKFHDGRRSEGVVFPQSLTLNGKSFGLRSVVNHYGSQFGGHYTAFIRKDVGATEGGAKATTESEWVVKDDAHTQPLNVSQLVSPAAYLLFYDQE